MEEVDIVKKITILIPVYNEEEVNLTLYKRLTNVINQMPLYSYELLNTSYI